MHVYSPAITEADAGGSLISSQPGWPTKLKTNLGYSVSLVPRIEIDAKERGEEIEREWLLKKGNNGGMNEQMKEQRKMKTKEEGRKGAWKKTS